MYQLICNFCKKDFSGNIANRKFCSPNCYSQSRITIPKIECPTCKSIFQPKKRTMIFCSRKCGTKPREKVYSYTCEYCKNPFERKKKGKKFCSNECYNQSKHIIIDKQCENCKKTFSIPYRFREQKYCDRKCMGEKRASFTEKNITNCPTCLENFEQPKNKKYQKEYCSYQCFNAQHGNDDIIKECLNCKIVFIVPYNRRSRTFCSQSCANSGEFNAMYGLTGENAPSFGRPAWNRGLTKETSPKLKELGQKISKLKNTPESIKSRSETTTNNWMNGVYDEVDFNSKFILGHHFSIKNQINHYYRSSWELVAFLYLDSIDEVESYQSEPFKIPFIDENNNSKNYLPDILISYKDGNKKLIEIKPERYLKDNVDKINAGQKYCEENNITYEIWTQTEIVKFAKTVKNIKVIRENGIFEFDLPEPTNPPA